MLKEGRKQLCTKGGFRLGCTMLQGQQVYLRIPKVIESYSSGCRLDGPASVVVTGQVMAFFAITTTLARNSKEIIVENAMKNRSQELQGWQARIQHDQIVGKKNYSSENYQITYSFQSPLQPKESYLGKC